MANNLDSSNVQDYSAHPDSQPQHHQDTRHPKNALPSEKSTNKATKSWSRNANTSLLCGLKDIFLHSLQTLMSFLQKAINMMTGTLQNLAFVTGAISLLQFGAVRIHHLLLPNYPASALAVIMPLLMLLFVHIFDRILRPLIHGGILRVPDIVMILNPTIWTCWALWGPCNWNGPMLEVVGLPVLVHTLATILFVILQLGLDTYPSWPEKLIGLAKFTYATSFVGAIISSAILGAPSEPPKIVVALFGSTGISLLVAVLLLPFKNLRKRNSPNT